MNLFLVGIITLFVGVFGWSQIVGSLQNIRRQRNLLFPLILWAIILFGVAYYFITQQDALAPTLIGYAISLVMVLGQGQIR